MIPSDVSSTILIDRVCHTSDGKDVHDALTTIKDYTKPLVLKTSSPSEDKINQINKQRRSALIKSLLSSFEFLIVTLSTSLLSNNIAISLDDKELYVDDGSSIISEIYNNILNEDSVNSVEDVKEFLDLLLGYPKKQVDHDVDVGRGYDKNRSFMSLVLDFICSEGVSNTYSKILFIRLLQSCYKYHPTKTQEEIIHTPSGGFHGLVLLCTTPTEEIRNEIIVFLLQVSSNTVIRKLLLFEDVMDTLLHPLTSFEHLYENIDFVIVQDCLLICRNIVKYEENGAEVLFDSRIARMALQLLLNVYTIKPKVDTSKKDQSLDEMLFGDEDKKNEVEWKRLSSSPEEKVALAALELLNVCFGDDMDEEVYHKRAIKFMSMEVIVSLLLSLSLFSPSSSIPQQSVVTAPSYDIQLSSLKLLLKLTKLLKNESMERLCKWIPWQCRLNALDALFHTSCFTNDKHENISLLCISILRNMLSPSTSCVLVLHSLTPPPDVYNLIILDLALQVANIQHEPSALALGIICINGEDSAREMLLKLTIGNKEAGDTTTFLTVILEIVLSTKNRNALLRLLCEWSYKSSSVVGNILQSLQSLDFFIKLYKDPSLPSTTKTLVSILLGICFVYFPDTTTEWTKESILSLLSHDGLTKYFTNIDKANLKIKNVPSEEEYFQTYFNDITSCIKSNIIQYLTSNNTIDNDSKLLLQKQQDEVSDLNQELVTFKKTIAIQNKELSIWKKRFDTFNTEQVQEEIDQMKVIESLQDELQVMKLEYEAKLKYEKDIVTQLQNQIVQDGMVHEELLQEKEGLEEDLRNLSSAYHTLEEMYNAKNGSSTGEASGETSKQMASGEGTLEELQVSAAPAVHEDQVLALQNEIQQLQESGRAAEEWMAMAVQRMDQLQLENTTLRQEIQNETNTSSNDEIAKLQEENVKLKQLEDNQSVLIQELEKEKESLIQENQQLKDKASPEDTLIQENQQLKQENQNLQTQQPTESKETDLQKELEEKNKHILELEQANAEAQEWMNNAVTHHQHLLQQVESLTHEKNNLLQGQTKQLSAQDEYRTIQNEMQQLKEDKDDMQMDYEHKMNDLQQKLDDVEDEKNVVLKKYDDTLVLLQQSKMEGDVVMKKMEEEKNGLVNELNDLKLEFDHFKSNSVSTNMGIDDENEELRKELYQVKHQLQILEEDMQKQNDEHQHELQEVQAKITQKLEEEHDDSSRHSRLEQEKLKNKLVDITLQRDNLQKSLDELQKRHDTESHNHAEAMKNFKTKLLEYQTWVKTAQEKEQELKADKKAAKSKCKELIQQTSILKEEMDALKKEKNDLKDQLHTYENETVNKFECMESLEAKVKTLQEENVELETQNATLEMENAELVDTISSQSEEIEALKNEKSEVSGKFTQAEQNVAERMKEVGMLRDELAERMCEIRMLQDELAKQRKEMEEAYQKKMEECAQHSNEEVLKKYEGQITILSQEKEELEHQLRESQAGEQKIHELESLLQQKENELAQSTTDVETLTKELTSLQEQSTEVISKWKERAESLEVNITNCQNEIKEKRKEAEDVISQWETHCSSLREQLEEQRQEGEEEWMNELCKKQGTIQELEGTLAEKEESLNQAEEEISILMKELQDMKNSSAEVVDQWKERSDQLEAIITEMESTLEEQRQDAERSLREQEASATHAISEWEKQCTLLKQQIVELEENLADAEETILALEEEWKNNAHEKENLEVTVVTSARVEELEKELTKVKHEYEKVSSSLDETQSQKDELMQTIMKQKEEMTTIHQNHVETEQVLKLEKSERTKLETLLSQETEAKLQVEKLLIDKQNAYLSLEEHIKERDHGVSEDIITYQKKAQDALRQVNDMQTIIGRLEGEIQRLQDASLENQSNQASQSALEMAADSLHSQLENLALDFASVQEALLKEREINILAQEEITRLELDVSYLLQRTDPTKGQEDDMRKISMQAADAKSRKERQEIVTLRSKLEQVTDELAHSKAVEREIESNYTSVCHEASSYQQELQSTKKELELVNASLEEMRQHLSNHRTVYQYRMDQSNEDRVSSLEKHRTEISTLQKELSQAHVDIDRLQYALKQSEKANAALVVTTILNKEEQEDNTNDVTKLKLEKEHLLLASSEAAAQTEQRIRDVYKAQMTSTNTELQLERELRRKAEEALEESQAQLKEENIASTIVTSTMQQSSLHVDNSANQKQEELTLQIQNLKEEKELLVQKLAAIEETNKLSESKYVLSESKRRDMDKELHFEASLSMELARLRSGNVQSPGDMKNTSADLITHHHHKSNTSALILTTLNGNQEEKYHADNDMYHVVSEMRRALLEERSMYHSLMMEHEDLLELVSHYDVTQSSLKNALMHIGGEKAVADALNNNGDVL